jgi:hypothetical protein
MSDAATIPAERRSRRPLSPLFSQVLRDRLTAVSGAAVRKDLRQQALAPRGQDFPSHGRVLWEANMDVVA